MPSFIFIIIIYSLVLAFLSKVPVVEISNPVFSYYLIHVQFIQKHVVLFIFILAILTLLFFFFNFRNSQDLLKRYFRFLQRFVFAGIAGSVIALVILFIIAWVELNVLSIMTNISPKVLGVETDSQIINDRMQQTSSPPEVVIDSGDGSLLRTIAYAQSGKDTFYGSEIVSNLPSGLVLPIQKTGEGVLMVGNTLIISRINSTDFQKISPMISYLFVKNYFPRRDIKNYPEVELMTKEEYQRNREKEFLEKLRSLDDVVDELESSTSSMSATITRQQELVVDYEEDLEEASTEREQEYIRCMNEGYYEEDSFVKINDQEDCEEQISDLRETEEQINDDLEGLRDRLQDNRRKLEQYKEYVDYYRSQQRLTQESSGYVSYEFASFEPPDKIKISLSSQTNTKAVADYFVLLVHEYLHYVTYNEEGEGLDSEFFNEGITEYIAREIIKSNLGVETNLAYPANVEIISQINKRVSISDLADIYFENDQERLEKVLDLAYGQGFYNGNEIILETLHYSSNTDQILNLANDVISDIGGDPLNREDLDTTYSSYE